MREDKNETRWDKLLHIRTMGRDDSHSDEHRFPYEPTPYCVLERLANSGCIRKGIRTFLCEPTDEKSVQTVGMGKSKSPSR